MLYFQTSEINAVYLRLTSTVIVLPTLLPLRYKICDDGILIQLLSFWALSTVLFLNKNQDNGQNYICNMSILSGSFPARLKYSVIKPLFKKGDKKDLKIFRPISLLTSFSKIFEKLYMQDFLNM
jgi:hypothetical protein